MGPQEATRIQKLKTEALKVASQILPVKVKFQALSEMRNFSKLPKPLLSKYHQSLMTLTQMSDESEARASGKSITSLPFSIEEAKEAIKVSTP